MMNRSTRYMLLFAVSALVGVVQVAHAVHPPVAADWPSQNYAIMQNDGSIETSPGSHTYTFYYSVWGRANWQGKGPSAIGYTALGACPWGTYSDFQYYSPNNQFTLAGKPGSNDGSAQYVATVSDYWKIVANTSPGTFPFTNYPYVVDTDLSGTIDANDPNFNHIQSGTWETVNAAWGPNGSTIANKDSKAPFGDVLPPGSGARDAQQGLTPGAYAANPNAPVWLGGFSFTGSGVTVGKVPYIIYDGDPDHVIGFGLIDGPTPEVSTFCLLGATMLPFVGYRLRRRRKQDDEA